MKRTSTLLVSMLTAVLLVGTAACSSDKDDSAKVTNKSDKSKTGQTTPAADSDDPDAETPGDETGSTGSGSPSNRAELVNQMTASMMEGTDASVLSEKDAKCWAERTVDSIGEKRLIESAESGKTDFADGFDFSGAGINRKEAEKVYDNFSKCGIKLREMILADLATDESETPESRQCYEKVFTDANLRTFMVDMMVDGPSAFMGEEGDDSGMFQQIMACGMLSMDSGDFDTEG